MHLVDLAGSEQFTEAQEGHGKSINQGLLALGKVFMALAKGSGTHVPYRDSTLTRMLRDSLERQCKSIILACLNPGEDQVAETRNVLKYMESVSSIHKDPIDGVGILHQKKVLAAAAEIVGGADPMKDDVYDVDDDLFRRTEVIISKRFGEVEARGSGDPARPLILYLHPPHAKALKPKTSRMWIGLITSLAQQMGEWQRRKEAEAGSRSSVGGSPASRRSATAGLPTASSALRQAPSTTVRNPKSNRTMRAQSSAQPAASARLPAGSSPPAAPVCSPSSAAARSPPNGGVGRETPFHVKAPAAAETKPARSPPSGGSGRESPFHAKQVSDAKSLTSRAASSPPVGARMRGGSSSSSGIDDAARRSIMRAKQAAKEEEIVKVDAHFRELRSEAYLQLRSRQQELTKQLTCARCSNPLFDPTRLAGCRHVLCPICVEATVLYFAECPVCAAALDEGSVAEDQTLAQVGQPFRRVRLPR